MTTITPLRNPVFATWRVRLEARVAGFQATHRDVDLDGSIFSRVLCVFLLAAAFCCAYDLSSPVRFQDNGTSVNLVVGVFLVVFASLTAKLQLAEATLLFRAGALVVIARLWLMQACALIFHTGRGFPFVDDLLASADRHAGFDWLAWFHFADDRPLLWAILSVAYTSIFLQLPAVCAMLAFARDATRLYTFLLAQLVSLAIVGSVAIFTPALGPYLFFKAATAEIHHAVFVSPNEVAAAIEWLRGDQFTQAAGMPPLITFPSYHACCAILFAWAMWKIPFARWAFVVLNLAMLAATPILGCHYLIDVVAGIAIAILAQLGAGRLVAALSKIKLPARPVASEGLVVR